MVLLKNLAKKYYLIILFTILFIAVLFLLAFKTKSQIKNVTIEDAHNIITNTKDVIILDVRTQQEYDDSHIFNSLLIPHDKLEDRIKELDKYKDTYILVYCKAGVRSQKALDILKSHGFKKIYHMYEGFSKWTYEASKGSTPLDDGCPK